MRRLTNKEIRKLLKELNIFQWQIAETIGIAETSLSRWFRKELTQEQHEDVITAIKKIVANQQDIN